MWAWSHSSSSHPTSTRLSTLAQHCHPVIPDAKMWLEQAVSPAGLKWGREHDLTVKQMQRTEWGFPLHPGGKVQVHPDPHQSSHDELTKKLDTHATKKSAAVTLDVLNMVQSSHWIVILFLLLVSWLCSWSGSYLYSHTDWHHWNHTYKYDTRRCKGLWKLERLGTTVLVPSAMCTILCQNTVVTGANRSWKVSSLLRECLDLTKVLKQFQVKKVTVSWSIPISYTSSNGYLWTICGSNVKFYVAL